MLQQVRNILGYLCDFCHLIYDLRIDNDLNLADSNPKMFMNSTNQNPNKVSLSP